MPKINLIVFAFALTFAASAQAGEPLIDNERITVWDTYAPLSPAQHDFVAVSLTRKGTATLGHKGEVPGESGAHTVVIELKDYNLAPIHNVSGYPIAFPRPHVEKLLENDKVIVWSYHWNPGEPTPMHFHDKDVLVVYEEDTQLVSTTPDGKKTGNDYKSGDIRFNRRDRTHTELLVNASGSAVMTELK